MGIEDKVGGRLKQAAGDLAGSEALRREGKEDERRADAKRDLAREQEAAARQQERVEEKRAEVERLEGSGGPSAIPDYDRLNADDVRGRLDGLTEGELAEVEEHERRHHRRQTVLDAIESRRTRA
jgi:uncharacterized protein YjbJ (UPF0337 family)